MKVNYYFRNPGAGNYSIENVFEAVMKGLDPAMEIKRYHTKKPVDLNSIFSKRRKADVHHITGAVNYLTFGLPGKKTILTVHDIGHYTETIKGWKKIVYKYLFWVFPLRRVKKITTISDFTKRELIKHFNIDSGKIVVIPNPVNPDFQFRPFVKSEMPIILQIGSGKNKNINLLLRAAQGLNVKLLLIRPPDPHLINEMERMGIHYEFRNNLSTAQLMEAYSESQIIFFVSTYEGFGLPIIEGMTIGRPVITSNRSPMKEVAGDAALLVDPEDVSGLRTAIIELIESPTLCKELIDRGIKQVQMYQLSRISKQYQDLYSEIANDHP
ncbi:MAG: glycosyltransferase family 4 protein [Cyclobacteriaceae bacterium]|nr:glycosyltransferase family 4 protein [Cyclobacteriaceae bacterium]